ncbi:MAG: poly-gamma-glutamate biosynthesis protein PgsC [Myxococcales bacterium]|nr:MAG: poly-gamma-glutamate biosynthesis protein PgsC [Myxococcales bacterium]
MPEIELLTVSIGLGLAASLLYGELFGLAAGGMVVPGYMALYANKPVDVGLTLLAALMTFGILKGLSQIAIVYGRRRTALTILIGYLVGLVFRMWLDSQVTPFTEGAIIGFIIPGLIAIWYQRQGVLETTLSLFTAAIIVRMVLVVMLGDVAI